VNNDLLAHRSEQQTLEASTTARFDHDEVGVRTMGEDRGGVTESSSASDH
jgi:hypothetical protein